MPFPASYYNFQLLFLTLICLRIYFFLSYLTHEFLPVEARSVKFDLYFFKIIQSAFANGDTRRNCKLIIVLFSGPFVCQACVMLLFSWRYNPLWLYFHSPVAGFSLLFFEDS